MPSDEAAEWYTSVYDAVQQIPYGKCTSYGHIAILLGYPKRARQVGVCLKYLPSFDESQPNDHEYHSGNVPWQRVVNAKGGISPRGESGLGARRQADRLRAEGVEVDEGRGTEEAMVDLSRYGWFPDELPMDYMGG
ncbi:hypothetical protein BT93_L1005 [Corymbia citriodora subsp. variegata]|uniref:Methylated-DNA-[protein]-cysteine S-methyltransferase DNA binding domain-containing protein n=1 Tax=Corymbia citriodora subsp. variegata TaxID=360336 RepID=A0A8T0CHZ6_CORYI|nr:hypothetical protein BT93_L1005 [Corymbia citriodora subsp. variegata]